MPRITPEEWISHPERFAAVEADPRYDKAMSAPPPAVSVAGGIAAPIVFLVFWLAIGSFILSGASEAGGLFMVVPIFILGAGVVMIGSIIAKTVRFANAPVERRTAVVLDERVNVSGGGEDSRATTSYYATLGYQDGNREELQTSGDVAGLITRGDIGVAMVRMNRLVAFYRIAD